MTVFMLLFSFIAYKMVSNTSKAKEAGLLNLVLPLLSEKLRQIWLNINANNKNGAKSNFWDYITLSKVYQQVTRTRTSVQESVNFIMFNIDEILQIQLQDFRYLKALQKGLQTKHTCENKSKLSEDRIYEEYSDGDVTQTLM